MSRRLRYADRPAPSGHRFDLKPLVAAAHVEHHGELAQVVGVSSRQVRRASQEGLSADTADRWAIAVGVHPSSIWGTEWWRSTLDG